MPTGSVSANASEMKLGELSWNHMLGVPMRVDLAALLRRIAHTARAPECLRSPEPCAGKPKAEFPHKSKPESSGKGQLAGWEYSEICPVDSLDH